MEDLIAVVGAGILSAMGRSHGRGEVLLCLLMGHICYQDTKPAFICGFINCGVASSTVKMKKFQNQKV
jgi:hypothetical protein